MPIKGVPRGLAMLVAALGLLAFSASAQALPDGLTLTPEAAENPLGTTHTLTATVTDAGKPVADVRVGFLAPDSSSARAKLSTMSDDRRQRQGELHLHRHYAGTETITAFADTKQQLLDGGEPSDTATKRWARCARPTPNSDGEQPRSEVATSSPPKAA